MRITQPSYPICSENEDTPSNCTLCVFLSHIHKKRPRGFYNEAKNLKISWFYAGEMREPRASKASKIPKRELVGGPYLKNKIGNFHSKYVLCYSESNSRLL